MEAAIYATAGLLLVGLLSGLSFLAVQFPKTFQTLSFLGSIVFVLLTLCYTAYAKGVVVSAEVSLVFVPPEKLDAAKAAVESKILPDAAQYVLLGFSLFMIILSLISRSIEHEKKKQIEGTGQGGE